MAEDVYRSIVVFLFLLVLGAGGMGYCAGRVDGARRAKLEQNERRIDAAATVRKDAEKASTAALVKSDKARETHRVARARVEITSDTTIEVDRIPHVVALPVVSLLRSSDQLHSTDSLTIVTLKSEIVALREERDAWKERAELLTPPRLGFKAGLVAGATATAGLVMLVASLF